MSIQSQIEELLAEPIAAAEARERKTFAGLLRGTDGSVVLFGAGRLGRLCARALRRAGVPLRAFCDGNRSLQGTTIDGVFVLHPAEAVQRGGGQSLFVVAIWTGTARESMVERMAWLRGLGCRHVAACAPLVWACGREEAPFHAFDLPTRVLAHAGELRRLAGLLGEDESRRVLLAALQQRLLGEFDDRPAAADQYFPGRMFTLAGDEAFVDGGAFDGDTLEVFLRKTGGRFGEYHAFEPDPENLERLRRRVTALPAVQQERIYLHGLALHDRDEELVFASHGGQTSQVAKDGAGRVRGQALDRVLAGRRVTFVKLDVEGAERTALQGARRTLREHRPIAAVCVYHGPADLWEIPLQLHDWLPGSRLFLRQHGFDGWETVCYAVPPERLAKD